MGEATRTTALEHAIREPVVLTADRTVADVHDLFLRDHQRLALVVDETGRLLTTITRTDLAGLEPDLPARRAGTLAGRTVGPDTTLADASARLGGEAVRRAAVVDADGRLLGLLCLKRSGAGYCTDEGVAARRAEHG